MRTVCQHITQSDHFFITRPRVAQDCTLVPNHSVIHASCFVPCRTWHWPPAQVLSHLPLQSYSHPLLLTQAWCLTIHIYLATIQGGVAVPRISSLPQKTYWSSWPATCPTGIRRLRRPVGTNSFASVRHSHSEVGAERNPQNREVICYVTDLQTSSASCMNVSSCVRESWRQSNQTTSSECTVTRFFRRAAEIFDEVWQRSLERLFPQVTEDSWEQATLSAGQSGIGRGTLPALHTLEPDFSRNNLLWRAWTPSLKHPPPPLEALDGAEKATASLYLLKAAQAASESWQQTAQGHNGATVTNPTVSEIEQSSSASQDDDDDDSELDFAPHRKSRLSAPQLQAKLSRLSDRTRLRRLKDTLHSKGAWQQVTRVGDLCHTHVSHKWL